MPIPAAVHESLATAADLREQPGAPFADEVVEAAAGTVRHVAGWHIAPEVVQTLTLDGPGTQTLFLPTLNLCDVLDVAEGGRTLNATDYDWSTTGYLERRSGLWTDRPRGINVRIRHGYGACPAPLLSVIAEECRRMLTNSEYQQDGDATPTSNPLSPESVALMNAFVIENGP